MAALEDLLLGPAVTAPARSKIVAGRGELLVMPASDRIGAGLKVVGVSPDNPARGLPLVAGTYTLFDEDLQPHAVLDGAALTEVRTAAVSAYVTDRLAAPDASTMVVFGAGVQARAHVRAVCAIRPIDDTVVVGRAPASTAAALADLRKHGLHVRSGRPADVANAAIVCTCTTATEPLFDGALVAPGAHVNAVGTHHPGHREVDGDLVSRARVVVETRDAAWAEAGELALAEHEGVLAQDGIVADLFELARGAPVRRHSEEITLFKSVGVAFEDLAVARAVAASTGE